MQIVIDKESLITLFTVAFYAICGEDYSDVKNTVIELLDKVGYTPLPEGHGRLIDADTIAGDGSWDWSDRLDATPTIIEAERRDKE